MMLAIGTVLAIAFSLSRPVSRHCYHLLLALSRKLHKFTNNEDENRAIDSTAHQCSLIFFP